MIKIVDLEKIYRTEEVETVTHSEHDARYAQRIIRMLDGRTILENRML